MRIKKSQIEILPETVLPFGQRSGIFPSQNPQDVEIEPKFEEIPDHYPWGNCLRPETSALFQVKSLKPGKYNFKDFGQIDLRNLTPEEAESLVKQGFKYLKRI